jgi:outer membrane protein insertion porin family
MRLKRNLLISVLVLLVQLISAQGTDSLKIIDYSNPKEYVIDTVIVTGVFFLDKGVLANMSGFEKGSRITLPSDDMKKVIKKYWDHGLFEDVQVSATMMPNDRVRLNIYLKERPRLSTLTIEGIKKSDKDELKEKLNLHIGSQITQDVVNNTKIIINKFYLEKGYFNIDVNIKQKIDTSRANRLDLIIHINKNKRVKIKSINISGNKELASSKILKSMKKTKKRDWKFWNSSKFIEASYKEDKGKIVDLYNEHGYRDAKIVSDSIKVINKKRIAIYIKVYEGDKYYFRKINWIGNTKYSSEFLSKVLSIKKGETFNQKSLDKRLQSDDDAVSSLYLDNGYLFFNVSPTEVAIDHDSIDFEMRIFEGRQATINNVIITGNTKTNEHVVRREIRTLPGELFSKADIIRTVRELATLGHFEPEKIEPVPLPNPANSTVDLEYKLVERANDQLEISGGWGMNTFVGTVGVKFSNFSYRNFFNLKEWRPVPSGDGQSLSLRLQSNGTYYRSYSISFADPWFGGKKPNSLSISLYYTRITQPTTSTLGTLTSSNPNQYMKVLGASVGLGRRLRWPDDYFTLSTSVNYERYGLKEWPYIAGIDSGSMNNLSFTAVLGRNSLDQYIYPRSGSNFSLTLQFTPPYSLFQKDQFWLLSDAEKAQITTQYGTGAATQIAKQEASRKYHWIEYNKWDFKAETYISLVGNLVLMTKASFGILGTYNKDVGYSPVEKYQLGGSGMSNYSLSNVEVIGLRGYEDGALTPDVDANNNLVKTSGTMNGGNIFDKFTTEIRYPIVLKEQSTIFGLVFAEAGNCWNKFDLFNPFDVKRSVGVGIRIFLPMFGLLGFDYGYGFDPAYNSNTRSGGQIHFTMGQQF